MRSVADDLREELQREMLALTPAQRVALATRLGERDLMFFMAGQNVSRDEAIRRIRRSRQVGRRRSRCVEE